jgi:hypothetical protein
MLRIPHCIDIQLIDGSKIVSLTHQPHSAPQNIIVLLLVPSSVRGRVNPGSSVAGRIR